MRRILYLLGLLMSTITFCAGQQLGSDSIQISPLIYSEVMPEFPGGDDALYTFLGNELKYPKTARQKKIQGTVFVKFVVEKDGSISNLFIEESPSEILSEETLKVLSRMPPWKPGLNKGKTVRVYFTLPVKFKLE